MGRQNSPLGFSTNTFSYSSKSHIKGAVSQEWKNCQGSGVGRRLKQGTGKCPPPQPREMEIGKVSQKSCIYADFKEWVGF